ncbi:MAG: deoxyguanosinetriphosphate triphosphohydrolase [Acidobacteria bacterium]|nr:deoxyguanosinetriphosphate triphosphohydrolase [Acidobacteriota bacterium]MBI3664039.1 deoxyguanosinetriphosphate triphosphohydrolase [Acidobacteriota bacterium]
MAFAPYAMQESASRGRRHSEPPHAYRSAYARDRDRVIHSRAFRRLESKTQVFTTRYSDHFRNRLTHTLEVAQIARTVAGALGLNTELVEALALVHDIGHPPFGHAGEQQLDELMREHGGRFDHNLHALRTVEQFEQRYLDFPGLNLTFEVREGIIKHSRDYSAAEFPELAEYLLSQRPPLEAQLIDLVDEIAYNTADLDDGYEAHLLDLPEILAGVPLFAEIYAQVDRRYPDGRRKLKFNEANKRALDRLVTDLIEHTRTQLAASGAHSVEDVCKYSRRLASFSPEGTRHNMAWKQFLLAHLYDTPAINEERDACMAALEQLFRFYLDHPEKMPKFYFEQAQREPRHRVVCDYIAGMTDHFLLRLHRELIGGASEHAD